MQNKLTTPTKSWMQGQKNLVKRNIYIQGFNTSYEVCTGGAKSAFGSKTAKLSFYCFQGVGSIYFWLQCLVCKCTSILWIKSLIAILCDNFSQITMTLDEWTDHNVPIMWKYVYINYSIFSLSYNDTRANGKKNTVKSTWLSCIYVKKYK